MLIFKYESPVWTIKVTAREEKPDLVMLFGC